MMNSHLLAELKALAKTVEEDGDMCSLLSFKSAETISQFVSVIEYD